MRTLFVGHQASRTGAPLLLLWWLRWLKERGLLDGELWLSEGGELVDEFRSILPVRETYRLEHSLMHGRSQMVLGSRLSHCIYRMILRRALRKGGFDRVWCNTACNPRLIRFLSDAGLPIACNIHELPTSLHQSYGRTKFVDLHSGVRRWVACAEVVRRGIVDEFGIPEALTEVVHEFHSLSPAVIKTGAAERQRIRHRLGLGSDDFLAGMVGTMEPRKGSDSFVRMVRDVVRLPRFRHIHLIWIGGLELTNPYSWPRMDLERIGSSAQCHLIPPQADVQPFLAAMDAFCLTSRVDPFPVAMLEAAASGLPILCFRGGGGAVEFVREDAGVVVPYLDEAGMLDVLLQLSRDPSRSRAMGEVARGRSLGEHTVEAIGPRLLEALRGLVPLTSV